MSEAEWLRILCTGHINKVKPHLKQPWVNGRNGDNMFKLLVSDLDGTLLNSCQELTDYSSEAVKKAIDSGIEFMVATGRSMSLIRPFLTKYGLKCGCILLNGAEVRDKDENILSAINVRNNMVIELHGFLHEKGYMPFYTTTSGVVYHGSQDEFENAIMHRQLCLDRTSRTREEAKTAGLKSPFAANAKEIKDVAVLSDESVEIRKIVVFDVDKEKNSEVIRELKEKFPMLAVAGSYPEDIEINDIKAQKGFGLEKAIKVMGISKDEVAVFGDGLNDVSMFEVFPHSYATANAVEEIKAKSEEIIDSNDKDGVGKKIFEFLSVQNRQ